MKTVYPVIATVLSVCLFCGCLHYSPDLLTQTGEDPAVSKTETGDYCVEDLPFVPPETTVETETTEETTTETTAPPHSTAPTEPTTTAPETETEEKTVQPTYGTAGRIEIPSAGIGVPLNFARLEIDDVQRIVDAPDSAAYFWFKETFPVIADHNNQGFANLHNVRKGDIAVASSADGRSGKYVCNCVCYGTNTGKDILDNEGFSIAGTVTADLIMYTCCDGWQNILLTYWKAVD